MTGFRQTMTSALPIKLEKIRCSGARLPVNTNIQRNMRLSSQRRTEEFKAAFDQHQLVYDTFWHVDGKRILLVGPPPFNLKRYWKSAGIIAWPSGKRLSARLHSSLSTMTVELRGAPENTERLELIFAGHTFDLPVEPNLSAQNAGARVLFSMNKNNELDWIAHWAEWHVRLHKTDSIFLFDNGSERYSVGDIEDRLAKVDGLRSFAVIPFPHSFGAMDPAVRLNPFWAHFAQISSMGIVLRRLASSAAGILNCDVDELANAPAGRSLYEVVKATPKGLLILKGRWVEPNGAEHMPQADRPRSHAQFSLINKDSRLSDSSPVKWILDPKRQWVASLDVHPYWHWIHKRPLFGKTFIEDAIFWHFRGINTGWKDSERVASRVAMDELMLDKVLERVREQFEVR